MLARVIFLISCGDMLKITDGESQAKTDWVCSGNQKCLKGPLTFEPQLPYEGFSSFKSACGSRAAFSLLVPPQLWTGAWIVVLT